MLPALACVILLATTNHLCQDVAVVPFLWVAPLSLYLLTFIICFGESAREIDYSSVETSSGSISSISVANSNTFSYLFLDAAVGCNSNKDPAKCNTLANLCVLQLYNEQATVC